MRLAVLNSVAEFDKLKQVDNPRGADAAFSVAVNPEDTVGVIGHIGPVIANLTGKTKRLMVFERDKRAASILGSGVTVLAGTKWPQANRDAVLAGISQCAGMQQLIRYGQKMTVRVQAD